MAVLLLKKMSEIPVYGVRGRTNEEIRE